MDYLGIFKMEWVRRLVPPHTSNLEGKKKRVIEWNRMGCVSSCSISFNPVSNNLNNGT